MPNDTFVDNNIGLDLLLKPGAIITTSYNTGPYFLRTISKLCVCPSYSESLNGNHTPSKPHYHLTMSSLDGKSGYSYLNGYMPDENGVWRSVWNDDFLNVDVDGDISDHIDATGLQMELF